LGFNPSVDGKGDVMAKYIICGKNNLSGQIEVPGNKNSALPILAATLLTKEDCILENVPVISDVLVMCQILQDLGVQINGVGTHKLVINTKNVNNGVLNDELVGRLRASVLLLGPLLARFGEAKMRHPGGCIIGRRAVGTHFDALETLGAKTITTDTHYESKLDKPAPGYIFLDEASVTATENVLMLASLMPGTTTIQDAACEPHIVDLAKFLKSMGAHITGEGTNKITIDGVGKLSGGKIRIGADFMDASSFAVIAAVTQSKLDICGVKQEDLEIILLYLSRMGLKFNFTGDRLTVFPSKIISPKGKIQTRPWPGFPTDVMSPFVVLATQAEGTTLCHDWMYESRMFFVDKLIAMGANITICDPHRVLVCGPTPLRGKVMDSPDIRAGMALICAALCAEGESIINNAEMVERGYENIEQRLKQIGANIRRLE